MLLVIYASGVFIYFQVVRPSAPALRSPLVSDDFPYLWQILCFTLWIL